MGAVAKPGSGPYQAPLRRRPSPLQTRAMFTSRELLLVWFLVLAVGGTEHVFRPGRRVCAVGAPRGPESESFVQRVYQPFLTTCDGHRACSTYRTVYRTAYRRSPGPAAPRPRYACCPGWKRTDGLPRACGADVDECRAGGGTCPQHCVNTAGSYWCWCWEGHSPSADGVLCLPKTGAPRVAPNPTTARRRHTSADDGTLLLLVRAVTLQTRTMLPLVDVQGPAEPLQATGFPESLWNREGPFRPQKLQLVLAPLHSLASRALEHGLPDPSSLLAHSLQQLDRIDSLSEQISLLEEQLGSCSCEKEL
ncbi:hypothetical protein GH733_011064 [Mirounga leonina]|nr:hypothetical protein GH733_011064 [Mirounga leonina]